MKFVLVCGAIAASLALAAPPQDTFNNLARRAEAALDSKPAEAADLYKKALALKPDWAEGWLYMGAALYQLDRFAEATDAFRKGVALAPQIGTGWAFLGMCEAELNDPDQALADIHKGESLGLGDNKPFEMAVRVKAAQVLIRTSAFDEAAAELAPLAKRGDTSPVLEQTMGMSSLGYPGSYAELTPERRAVVDLIGKAAWESALQHPAESAQAYKEAIARFPNEPGVHYAYALYVMETDLEGAVAELRKDVQVDPKHWPALVLLGSLEIKRGATEPALDALRQALKVVPTKYRWLCHAEIGRASLTAGNAEAAIAEFQSALRVKPEIAQIHYFLAQALRRSGKAEEAQKEMAEFQKLKVQQDPLGVGALRPFGFTSGK